MKELEPLLRTQPLTNGMNPDHIRKIAECASYFEIPGGRYIFRQGESAEEFYMILDGSVEVELFSASGGPVVLQKVATGSVLGWSWLIAPYEWRFDARTLEPICAIRVDAQRLLNLMEKDAELGYEVTKRFLCIVSDRLESERMRLVDLYATRS